MAQLAQLAAPQPAQPPQPKRPADVEPEAFYRYTEPQAPEDVIAVAAVNRQPLHLTIGVDPEVLYTYTPTPEPTEPVVTSLIKPEPQALEPEQRFTYAETPEVPTPVVAPLSAGGDLVPDLPVMLGFAGLERLPGRVIRYVVER
jgi:hypothetical protein